MGELSWWHWLIVVAALVLLFGANKLPQMARSLGQSVRILRSETRAMNEDKESKNATNDQSKDQPKEQQSLESSGRGASQASTEQPAETREQA